MLSVMNYGNGPLGPPPPPGGPYGPPPGFGPPPAPPPPQAPYAPLANPYAAPYAGPPVVSAGGVPGSAMKWLFVAGYAGYWVFAFAGYAVTVAVAGAADAGDATALAGTLLILVGVLSLLLGFVASLVWLYKAWSTVPQEMRYSDSGKWVTPGQAVGYLFIPFYNLYWVFIANVGLCEAVNRTLLSRGRQPQAPKGVAIAACVTHIIPYCNLLVAPVLWTIYMFQVDRARREMLAGTYGG